jgi:hypothetical protein
MPSLNVLQPYFMLSSQLLGISNSYKGRLPTKKEKSRESLFQINMRLPSSGRQAVEMLNNVRLTSRLSYDTILTMFGAALLFAVGLIAAVRTRTVGSEAV